MLVKPTLEKLLPKVDNRYTLAILVAKRARQLVDGAQPLMESDSPNNVTIACEELASNRIACYKGLVNPYIPLRPEIEAARIAARNAAAQASMADAVKEALDQAADLMDEESMDESDVQIITDNLIDLETVAEPEADETVAETDVDETVADLEADEAEASSSGDVPEEDI